MQKINREALREAFTVGDAKQQAAYLAKYEFYPDEIFSHAARILLEITGEDWEPSEEVMEAAALRDTRNEIGMYAGVFKAMLRELVE